MRQRGAHAQNSCKNDSMRESTKVGSHVAELSYLQKSKVFIVLIMIIVLFKVDSG